MCRVCGGRVRARSDGGWRVLRSAKGCGCAHVSPRYVGIGITERFFCPFFRRPSISNRAPPVSNRAPSVSNRRVVSNRAPARFKPTRRFKPRPVRFKPARRFKPRPTRCRPARRFKPRPARVKTPGGPTQLFAVSFPGPNQHGFAPSHDDLTSQVGECRAESNWILRNCNMQRPLSSITRRV